MFDDKRFEIPEMHELRRALSEAAGRERVVRASRRGLRAAAALACSVGLLGAALLAADPFNDKPGLDQALAEIAAKIELAPDAPRNEFTYSRITLENLEVVPDGIDRLGRRFEGGFPVWKARTGEIWVSRTKQGATYFRGAELKFANDRDRATGERIIWASKEADEMAKTPRGRRELRKLQAPFLPRMMEGESGGRPFFFADLRTQEVERGTINPDGDFHWGPMRLTQREVEEFSRDPQAAYEKVAVEMEKQADEARDVSTPENAPYLMPADELTWQALTSGAGFFNDPPPADLRATFVRALRFVPGVKVMGEVKDSKGRNAVAFSKEWGGVTSSVAFDAESAVLIEQVSTLSDPSEVLNSDWSKLPLGTITSRSTLEEIRTVAEIPEANR